MAGLPAVFCDRIDFVANEQPEDEGRDHEEGVERGQTPWARVIGGRVLCVTAQQRKHDHHKKYKPFEDVASVLSPKEVWYCEEGRRFLLLNVDHLLVRLEDEVESETADEEEDDQMLLDPTGVGLEAGRHVEHDDDDAPYQIPHPPTSWLSGRPSGRQRRAGRRFLAARQCLVAGKISDDCNEGGQDDDDKHGRNCRTAVDTIETLQIGIPKETPAKLHKRKDERRSLA